MVENFLLLSKLSLLFFGVLVFQNHINAQPTQQPNILFIAIDDMNDWTTIFDEDNPIKTPNLEKLVDRGAFFSRAYTSSPACNPSRSSIMTGTRPHKTGIYSNNSDWRRALPNVKTIQQYFMDHGYYIGGAGKIFHHALNWAFHDNASFNEYLLMQINKPYPPTKLNGFDWFGTRNTDWGAWPENIEQTPDYKTSEYAINFLKRDYEKPFFLNVGIYKPHSPFFAPEDYFENYPISDLEMPKLEDEPHSDLPSGAMSLLEARTGSYGSGMGFWYGLERAKESNPIVYEEFVQAYQAASTFADAMVGRVINALDKSSYRDNTIIILWSDHGFHLGEKHTIEKFALWEKTTRVPLIIIAPGQTQPGTTIDTPVDLTSLYPTLVDLAGLEPKEDLSGHSLTPLLNDPDADFPPALTTYLKGNHAIRKDNWRYIQYQDGSEEMYDLSLDPLEWRNLAGDPKYKDVIHDLRKYIPTENAKKVPDYRAW